ncbi:MAG: NAD(P)-dependent oxidoreductase [Acidimicrobiales bacterium]|nr:NAD(P)-dependent oxidoreductase [Acidimicrobiales bacterium]
MTPRIVIVGANGNVGTELALRLASGGAAEVVGVCRNRSGSAFLRLHGIECRHGDVTNASEARALLADSDVVLQLAYSVPRTRQSRLQNRLIVVNCVRYAPRGAAVVLASTIMVYAPNVPFVLPDAYGLEKRRLERIGRGAGTRHDRPVFVFRLGHCLGPLQPQSTEIERSLAGPVSLPAAGERDSNTIYVASIAEALMNVADGRARQGVYDLVSWPQWSWRQVYEEHAQAIERRAQISRGRGPGWSRDRLRRALRDRLLVVPQHLPTAAGERLYGAYLQRNLFRRASTSLSAGVPEATSWRPVGRRPLPGLADPRTALRTYPLPPLGPLSTLPRGWRVFEFGG